jgi:rod shape-determining protein MreB
MAEDIKINIGSALPVKEKKTMEIRGRDLVSGLPRTVEIHTNEVCEAITNNLKEITQAVKEVLRNTPPELSADVIDKGMILAGGGALLKNIDTLFSNVTGVPAYIADEPLLCVAKGTGIVLENLEAYKRSIMSKK